MLADALVPEAWLRLYRELLAGNDLQPFMYATRPQLTSKEQYAENHITIPTASPYWIWGVRCFAYNKQGDQENGFATQGHPSVDYRIRMNGDYAWTAWCDASALEPIQTWDQWGEGFVLPASGYLDVEWRRPYPLAQESILEQYHQWVFYGAHLEPLGTVRVGKNWRNVILRDWQTLAKLRRVLYSEDALEPLDMDTSGGAGTTTIQLKMGNRDFVCDRIHVYAMDATGEDDEGQPTLPGPWLSKLTFGKGGTMHNQDVQGIASAGWGGVPGYGDAWKFRVPRLIPANETIRIEVGFNPWPAWGSYADGQIFPRATLAGYSITRDYRE